MEAQDKGISASFYLSDLNLSPIISKHTFSMNLFPYMVHISTTATFRQQLLHMPGTVLNTIYRLSHLILITHEKDRQLFFWQAILFIPKQKKKEVTKFWKVKLLPQLTSGPSLFSNIIYSLLISLIFPPDDVSHAQLICLPVFLTQLSGESPARIKAAICSPSGWRSIVKDSPTAMQIGVLNYSWLLVMRFKFKLVYPERVLNKLTSSH